MKTMLGLGLILAACMLFVVEVTHADDGLEFARRLHKEGRHSDALEAVNMAISRKDDADARVLRGFIKEALGDKEGALADYNHAASGDAPASGGGDDDASGVDNPDNLKDNYGDCKGWSFMCNHDDKKEWMAEHCPLTCHLLATGQNVGGGVVAPQEIPEDLKDKYAECVGWASVCEVIDECHSTQTTP